ISSSKAKEHLKVSSSFRVCCDGSRSAAIDVFILIVIIISYGFLIIPCSKFITVKAVFINLAARRLHKNGLGSVEVVYMRSSAAYQAMKSYINVQLAEETVAHRQARALERVWICNQNTAEIFSDAKYNIYDADKTYELSYCRMMDQIEAFSQ
ncbi:hypothetical protein HID58_017821, partial [Brassica napus]